MMMMMMMMIMMMRILKAFASYISQPRGYICNYWPYTGIFADCLQIAVEQPLYKKGRKIGVTNYKPTVL